MKSAGAGERGGIGLKKSSRDGRIRVSRVGLIGCVPWRPARHSLPTVVWRALLHSETAGNKPDLRPPLQHRMLLFRQQ